MDCTSILLHFLEKHCCKKIFKSIKRNTLTVRNQISIVQQDKFLGSEEFQQDVASRAWSWQNRTDRPGQVKLFIMFQGNIYPLPQQFLLFQIISCVQNLLF